MALDTPPLRPLWDIFCRVVDNLGDIGVCWRLARQLAAEYPVRVRLWVDAPEVLAPLLPAFDPALERQEIEGVRIARWQSPLVFEQVADVVIEAFACDPPAGYLAAMADRPRPPCWVNLEYLSAEPWVAGCHGLASPHRRLPLVKFFCFPGLVPGTGGLLREQDLLTRRDAFLAQEGPRRFLMELGLDRRPIPSRSACSVTTRLRSPTCWRPGGNTRHPSSAWCRRANPWRPCRNYWAVAAPGK